MTWLLALLFSVAVLLGAMTIVAYLTWIERKVSARFQNRVGPYFVGRPHGWLQPLADVAKLMIKEDLVPRDADRLLFNLAPILVIVPSLLGFAFLPLGKDLAIVDHPYSFLFFTAFASLTLFGFFAAGWASNNKYALLSAVRMVAMLASYEIPLLLSLLVPAVLSGSFRLVDVVEAQRGLWFVANPFGLVAFLVFFIAALAEGNKAPLDLMEAESELIAAYNVEYSGIKFALFYAGEYAHGLAVAALAATVFLGGYLGPGPAWLGVGWLVLKSLGIFVAVLWVRWSMLRLRIDAALRLNWLALFPVSLVVLVGAAFWALTRVP